MPLWNDLERFKLLPIWRAISHARVVSAIFLTAVIAGLKGPSWLKRMRGAGPQRLARNGSERG